MTESLSTHSTQSFRLPYGGRIERQKALSFTFNGIAYQGYRGDTLASALLANGVYLVGRSFKYHRPRGIIGSGAEEPNALVQMENNARTSPNICATQAELYEGLSAQSVNCWPSLEFDLRAINQWFGGLLPAGFYYKTFMWPKNLWPFYEKQLRRGAGFGVAPQRPDPDFYDKTNAHCDLLIAGGGPAGLAAALAAGRAGARVIIADEQAELGGSLLYSGEIINGRPATEWLTEALRELASLPEVTLLSRTTVFGYYDYNFLALAERRTDHLPAALASGPRQRLWRVRAKKVIIATGSIERPLVFGNNDVPGTMLASAVSTYVRRYAVAPGKKAVVFTNNDSAYRAALDLAGAGVEVAAVIDVRPRVTGALAEQVRQREIRIIPGHAVTEIQGSKRIEGVRIMSAVETLGAIEGPIEGMGCDLVAMSGGWNPSLHLYAQSGGRALWDEDQACFVPGDAVQAQVSVGACAGSFDLGEVLLSAYRRTMNACQALGFTRRIPILEADTAKVDTQPLRPLWLVAGEKRPGHGAKQFVDYQNDVTAADILLAERENFQSIEHVKRYTALGFGTDQGKLGNINGMAILARRLDEDVQAVGTTTFRPAYTPVTFGVIAGRDISALLDPVRKTAMHAWHEQAGAVFEDVGQWKRPRYYPKKSSLGGRLESMQEAVDRECLAVRQGVGILDASTLGKIDIQGPDAVTLLNWVYTNSWSKLGVGRCRYGLMLGEDGMVMDDGVTSRLGEQHYLMTTTTGNAAAVLQWLERWLQTEWPELQVYLTSVTDHWATLSLAGPKSREVIGSLCDDIDFSAAAFPFMSCREGTVCGVPARVMRISFSGELGYEINVPANYGRSVWEAIMEAGKPFAITPYGTETMHVLRAEKGFIIVGQETDGSVTPVDLGMDGLIGKKEFLGKRSLQRVDCLRPDRKQLVGLLTADPQEVLPEGGQVIAHPDISEPPVAMLGHITSSYYSATLGRSIALALIKSGRDLYGETVYIPLELGRVVSAQIGAPVFYDAEGDRQNV